MAVTKKARTKALPAKQIQTELTTWDYNPPIYFYQRISPKTEEELYNIGREMVAWAQRDTSLVFSNFFSQRELPYIMSDVYKWADRSESLRKAIELTKQILAGRREEGGITWKYNFNAIRETQPLYDPEYKVWKLEAIKSTADNIEKIVILPAIPKPTEE